MVKREWTEQEEQIFRMVHHDFEGRTVKEAAEKSGLSASRIYKILAGLKKKAPQLFPILTQYESAIADMIMERGMSVEQVALVSKKSVLNIYDAITNMKEKGFVIPCLKKPIRYTKDMDSRIREKF